MKLQIDRLQITHLFRCCLQSMYYYKQRHTVSQPRDDLMMMRVWGGDYKRQTCHININYVFIFIIRIHDN